MKSQDELDREFLGTAAIEALDRLVAAAPPLTPEQRDAIAILLGHRPASQDEAA